MSWQTYVDDHLMVPLPNGGHLSHAAIVGQDGGVWAQDAGFPAISVEETQALVKGCNDTSTALKLQILLVSYIVGATHIPCSGHDQLSETETAKV